jgi:hypothetical protein
VTKTARKPKTDTIPKLDQVTYLFDTLGLISEQLSFDAIRKELIRLLPEERRERARHPEAMFWSNVRDALRELMRLGLVEKASLPSRAEQLDAHRDRMFALTEAGRKFLELEQSEIPGDAEAWRTGPPEDLDPLSGFLRDSVTAVMGSGLDFSGMNEKMRPYLIAAWKRLDTELKAHTFSQAVVKAVNDVAIRALLQVNGLRMDYVTFRSAVGLLSDLNAIWSTRSLTGRRGWTIWATSTATVPAPAADRSPGDQALRGAVWFKRRPANLDAIQEALMSTFFSLPGLRGGFALVHELRAAVCHQMNIHGHDFDAVLRKLHSQSMTDATYSINLDRGGADELPKSEEPFRIGERAFYLITLLKRD